MVYSSCPSPLGTLVLEGTQEGIARLRFLSPQETCPPPASTGLFLQAEEELRAYFHGDLQEFTLPLLPQGTPFQQEVWAMVERIPYGCLKTYGEIASLLGNSGYARGVGSACRKNPLLLLCPCHRVVNKNPQQGAYVAGLWRKRYLLQLESGQLPLLSSCEERAVVNPEWRNLDEIQNESHHAL